ncbi:MAG: fibronectin type III domain-containing protein [Steroidobacter sp.]
MKHILKLPFAALLIIAAVFLNVSNAASVAYEFDAEGRVSRATYQNGTYVDYSYDANGNRTSAVMTIPPDVTAPTAPATLTANRVSHTRTDLSWAASTDIVGVTGYRVERCTGATCTTFAQLTTRTTTTYSNTGLTAGTTYRYRVRAVDGAGNLSGYSPIATSAALETTPPSTPASLTATAISQTQINLSWAASTDNIGILNYRVERCTGAACTNFSQITTRTTTTYSNTGLSAGTSYRYRVRASDAAGNLSGYSPIANATTLDTTVPTTPGAPTFSNLTATSATANWTASTDNVGVVGYNYRLNAGTWQTLGNVTSVALTGLSPGTNYTFEVRARDAAGNLSAIASSTFSLSDSTAPGAPGTPAISSITASSATATWSAATDNVAVTGYDYRLDAQAWQTLGNVLTVNLTGLTQATNYTFQVRARDGANNIGAASSTTFMSLDTSPPGAPGPLSFSSITMTTATVNWTAASDNVGVTGYRYQVNSGAWQTLGNVTTAGLTGLTAVTTYSVAVSARDAAGNWGPARTGSFTTPDTAAPSAPTGLSASAPSSNRVNLNWSVASDNIGVAGYRIYRNSVFINTSGTNSYADASVVGTTTYSYQVSAYDAAGNESGRSSAAGVTTPDTIPPSDPSGLSAAAASTTQINLNWSGSSDTGGSGLAGYRVYRNGSHAATVGSTSHSDTGLSDGVAYTYYVTAVDGAGNASGASNSASATTPQALRAGTTGSWIWYKAGTQPVSQSPPAVVNATGGAGGYTYAWEYVSGDTAIAVVSPTSSSTIWSRASTTLGVTHFAYWRCRVRDLNGTVVYTGNVYVEFRRDSGN